ncbi:MAG: N-acyl-D-glucosamine 2-epimerase [gamma proteobacterium symbiont of Ctena orbiculata]|nr:MAG: N-acyl-D-glucosamine 2-epimerase [gamma proteobacterium symbiont of Ctena orbiculata]
MDNLKYLTQALSIMGRVRSIDVPNNRFTVETRGGIFEVTVKERTFTDTLRNLDNLPRNRDRRDKDDLEINWCRKIFIDDLINVFGIWHHHEGKTRFDAVAIRLLHSARGYLQFEHTNWWIRQLVVMADKWLDDLFGDRRSYQPDDFAALYRTNLNILGLSTDDESQEMATLSRLLYGLASAYLVTGDERYYLASKAGVKFQQQAFRSYSTDGRFCFWYHAIRRGKYRNQAELPSNTGDDDGTIPLYEQIYALAGLALFYRITGDWEVLYDIRLTVRAMLEIWGDWKRDKDGNKYLDGFYSHVDPVTFTVDDNSMNREGRDNRRTKNWNSIGDHIPAYLVNLMLALDPLPTVGDKRECEGFGGEMDDFLADCINILKTTAFLIRDHFPEEGSLYVQERFRKTGEGEDEKDWVADKTWNWQQDLGVVGHNLKISWNLTRVGNWLMGKGEKENAETLFKLARELGKNMSVAGVDQIRSGLYDTMERTVLDADVPIQFGWENTKDFWQQEQGILAYLIMFGQERNPEFLELARQLSAFWNINFLDRAHAGIFFRVNDNGQPIIEGEYGDISGHSKSGYHVFELGYLAHIYQLAFLPRAIRQHTTMTLHFRPDVNSGLRALNVLPDLVAPGVFEIQSVTVNGVKRQVADPHNFQIPLVETDLGKEIIVAIWQSEEHFNRFVSEAIPDVHLN